MRTLWTLLLGFAGLWMALKVFGGIIGGEAWFLAWHFKRSDGERKFAAWMFLGSLFCLLIFLLALKVHLAPLPLW
ncbi:MAG TPA: hypothetical protein VKX17_19050 [Planctomycetota bacterium]|nr:hypothetical protein [Planctomycetota bacterium]